jgi:hypothetical protein
MVDAKHSSDHRSTLTGFTLAETAFVLVVTGLVLGGVLKGQELVVQSKIKHVIADINGVSVGPNRLARFIELVAAVVFVLIVVYIVCALKTASRIGRALLT